MENGIWSEWSLWSPCSGDCNHSVLYRLYSVLAIARAWRWRNCKQLVGYLLCVGQPFEMRCCIKPQCKLPILSPIYPGGRKTQFTKPGDDKLHNQMKVKLSEKSDTLKGGPNSKSDQNNRLEHNQVYNSCCTRGEN